MKDNTALSEEYQSDIVIADLPLLPIYRGLPGVSLIVKIFLQKNEYYVPFPSQVWEFHHLGLKSWKIRFMASSNPPESC